MSRPQSASGGLGTPFMPTHKELNRAIAKKFNVFERTMKKVMTTVDPELASHPDSQIKPWVLKKVIKNIPRALKESTAKFKDSGLKRMRGLKQREDVLRGQIKRDIGKLAAAGLGPETESKAENKDVKRGRRESGIDYLDRLHGRQTEKGGIKESALTSGSALVRQEVKPPPEARAERQAVKPVHVELAPGIEKIESARGGEGEPLAPDIG